MTLPHLTPGDSAPQFAVQSLHDVPVSIPATEGDSRLVHIQFRRYAGCPICNLHLRGFAARIGEINAAGVREVVFFHSSAEEMAKYQSALPFDAVADLQKMIYQAFGVESSPTALLHSKAIVAIATGIWQTRPATVAEGGKSGLPADFLLTPDGCILAAHYGTHANDQWSVGELLMLAASAKQKTAFL